MFFAHFAGASRLGAYATPRSGRPRRTRAVSRVPAVFRHVFERRRQALSVGPLGRGSRSDAPRQVRSVIKSLPSIAAFDGPCTTHASTSRSRAERCSSGSGGSAARQPPKPTSWSSLHDWVVYMGCVAVFPRDNSDHRRAHWHACNREGRSPDLPPRLAAPHDLVVGICGGHHARAELTGCERPARRDHALATGARRESEADDAR